MPSFALRRVSLFLGLAVLPALLALAETPSAPQPIVQHQRGNVTNLEIEGNLAPTRKLPCISVTEAESAYTPPDLHTGIMKCIAQKEYSKAARLFVLAGIYARFDAERVADRTARAGVQVLTLQTLEGISKEQKEEFADALSQIPKDPSKLQALCSALARVGPPSYFPKYLVLHGMNAFTAPNPLENALVPAFDGKATWAHLLDAFAHCPK